MGKEFSVMEPPTKKSVSSSLKHAVWDTYIGIGVQKALCQLCLLRTIHSNVNSGFECAHIVARVHLNESPTIYYLYPSCEVCNNQCRNDCIFDFLWARNRLAPLRKALLAVFKHYVTEHEHELAVQDRMIHLVLDTLYGSQHFPLGGGIVNKKQIYEIARVEQYEDLLNESNELEKRLLLLHQQRKNLMEAEIKPTRLNIQFL